MSSNYMHDDALIQYLIEDARFVSVKLPLAEKRDDDKWYSCVEIFSDKDVRLRIEQAEKQPQAKIAFYRDQLLTSDADDSTRYWSGHTFQYYQEDDSALSENNHLYRAIIGDTSRADKPQSDPAGLLVIAIDPSIAKIYYLDYYQTKHLYEKTPKVYAEKALEFAIRYNAWNLAVELAKSDAWIKGGIENVFDAAGYSKYRWVDLDVTSAGTGISEGEYGCGPLAIKKRRAFAGAQLFHPTPPSHTNGHVWLSPKLKNTVLTSTALACPNNKTWCATDCMGYVQQVMRFEKIHWEDQRPHTEDEVMAKRKNLEQLRQRINRQMGVCA